MLQIPPTNLLLLVAKQEPYKKSLSLNQIYWRIFWKKLRRKGQQAENNKTERVTGLGRYNSPSCTRFSERSYHLYKTDKYAHSILMKQDKFALKWLAYPGLVEGTYLASCTVDFLCCLCNCQKYFLQSRNVTVQLYCRFCVLPQVFISNTSTVHQHFNTP